MRSCDVTYDLWDIVILEDIIPTKIVDGRLIDKTRAYFDQKDNIIISKIVRTKNYLICGFDRSIYNSV